ncbi:MAG: hypothetical protein KGI27_13410 [Thaumarchaeota archaeon]|nr:hypothetical protein [Nitrososphaerota archaeon]
MTKVIGKNGQEWHTFPVDFRGRQVIVLSKSAGTHTTKKGKILKEIDVTIGTEVGQYRVTYDEVRNLPHIIENLTPEAEKAKQARKALLKQMKQTRKANRKLRKQKKLKAFSDSIADVKKESTKRIETIQRQATGKINKVKNARDKKITRLRNKFAGKKMPKAVKPAVKEAMVAQATE